MKTALRAVFDLPWDFYISDMIRRLYYLQDWVEYMREWLQQ